MNYTGSRKSKRKDVQREMGPESEGTGLPAASWGPGAPVMSAVCTPISASVSGYTVASPGSFTHYLLLGFPQRFLFN